MSPQKSVFPSLSLFVIVSMFFYRNGEAMKPAEQHNYSLASSAVPLSNACKSISRQSLYTDKKNADRKCLQAFALLDRARYNVCNGYSEAMCRLIQLPSSTSSGTYLCTVMVSNVIRSFEDCAPALGLPTFGEGSTSSTGGGGFSTLLCFTTPRKLQIEKVGQKRRLSPPSPPTPPSPVLESSWGPQTFGSSSVTRSNTRPRYADPTTQDQSRSRRTSPPGGQSSSRRTSPPGGQSSSRRTSPPPSGLIQDPTFGVADLDGADTQYTVFLKPGTSQTGSEAGHLRGSSGVDEAGGESRERTNFQCFQCSKYYKTQGFLQLHFWTHGEGPPLGRPLSYPPGTMCHACNKDFYNRKNLLNHMKKDHEGTTTCPICQRVCSSTSALSTHKKKMHRNN